MSKFLSFLSFFLPISLAIFGAFLAIIALNKLFSSTNTLECFCPSCEALAFVEKGADGLGLIRVDIQGAVKKPGVYRLTIGQRVADLLSLAGGFLEDADQFYVANTLNLATELKDQDKVYIPFLGEENSTVAVSDQVEASATSTNLVSINQADLNQLKTLSGIGDAKAQGIISNRPYSSLEDLVSKKVISENLLSDLRAQMTL